MIQESNLSFLGGAAAFHRTSGSSGENDKFNFDVWNERWSGPSTKFEAFRRLWPKNKQHATYKWLFLIDLQWTEGPEIEAVLQFKGTLERQSKLLLSSDTRLQPLQLKNEGGSRTQAEYYGPTSTYRYIVVGEHPKDRAFAGQMLATNFAYEIFNLRGPGNIHIASGSGSAGTTSIGLPGTNTFTLVPRVVTSRFSCEQVGACWQVTEENEGRLEPPELRPTIGQR